jgi:hypothetical protein
MKHLEPVRSLDSLSCDSCHYGISGVCKRPQPTNISSICISDIGYDITHLHIAEMIPVILK